MKVQLTQITTANKQLMYGDVPVNAFFSFVVADDTTLVKKIDSRHAINMSNLAIITVKSGELCNIENVGDVKVGVGYRVVPYGNLTNHSHFEFAGEEFIKDDRIGALSVTNLNVQSFPHNTMVRACCFDNINVQVTKSA